jgi:hypothetical protein
MMSDVLYHEMGLRVEDATPMLVQHQPETIPFSGPSWCQPSVTLHHVHAQNFEKLYNLERSLNFSRLLLRDVYSLLSDRILPRRNDWDNGSDAKEIALPVEPLIFENDRDGHLSSFDPNVNFDSCKAACERNEQCFQFYFRNTTVAENSTTFHFQHQCHLSSAFRLGLRKPSQEFFNPEEPGVFRCWTSGWLTDRILQWVERNRMCAKRVTVIERS